LLNSFICSPLSIDLQIHLKSCYATTAEVADSDTEIGTLAAKYLVTERVHTGD